MGKATQQVKPQNLTLIIGLGRTSQDRLYEANIQTFGQLINTPVERLHTITKADISLINRWLEDAAKFISGEWE